MKFFKVHIILSLLIGLLIPVHAQHCVPEATPGVARFYATSDEAVAYTWLIDGVVVRDAIPVNPEGNRRQEFDTSLTKAGGYIISVIPLSDSGVWGIEDTIAFSIIEDFTDFSVQASWSKPNMDVCEKGDTSHNIINIALNVTTSLVSEGDLYSIIYSIDDGDDQKKVFNTKKASLDIDVKDYPSNYTHEFKILAIYYGPDTSCIISYRNAPQIMALDMRKLPYVNLGADIEVCENEKFSLDAGNYQTVTWNDNISGQYYNGTAKPNDTLVWVKASDVYNCSVTDTLKVKVNPLPFLYITDMRTGYNIADTMLCGEDKINLKAISNGVFFDWNSKTDTNIFIGNNDTVAVEGLQSHSKTPYKTIYVQTTDEHFCVSVAKVDIIRCISPNIDLAPRAFTPNGDDKNDYWDIPYLEYFPNSTVDVYDRWGRIVYHSKGYKIKWDGKFEGQDQPMDNYYYIIKLDENSKPYTGNVMIIR
jgi:gliding motility-associated-like protein